MSNLEKLRAQLAAPPDRTDLAGMIGDLVVADYVLNTVVEHFDPTNPLKVEMLSASIASMRRLRRALSPPQGCDSYPILDAELTRIDALIAEGLAVLPVVTP